jgi:hypothetical protein
MRVVKDMWAHEYAAEEVANHGTKLTAEQAHTFLFQLGGKTYEKKV